MRFILVLLALTAVAASAQDRLAPPAGSESPARKTQREVWGLTVEQYLLVDRSRRPGGDTYKYWKARKRGPYGNLVERIPGGPIRPVKI